MGYNIVCFCFSVLLLQFLAVSAQSSYRSYQKSFISYSKVAVYSTVSECCFGYTGNSTGCQDVDECLTDKGGCTQTCNNIDGSYQCSCWDGYQLHSDNHTCIAQCIGGCQNGGTCTSPDVCTCAPGWVGSNCGTDVNECLTDNGGCTQTCNNINGSYQCSCQDDYQLDSDNHTCIDIGECSIGTHSCSQLCVEMDEGYKCDCSDGYELGDDGVTCEDIDECTTSNGGCQHVCNNNNGSHQCLCHDGYMLGADKYKCKVTEAEKNTKGNSSGTMGIVFAALVLAMILLVLIFCILTKKYWKKYNLSSIIAHSSTAVVLNPMTTVGSKKETELNEDSSIHSLPMENDYTIISDPVPQDYEVHYDNVQY